MSTDPRYYKIDKNQRIPFNEFKCAASFADSGLSVIPVKTGFTPYLKCYQVTNLAESPLEVYVVHSADKTGTTQIATRLYVKNATTQNKAFSVPVAGSKSANMGVLASSTGSIEVGLCGYYSKDRV